MPPISVPIPLDVLNAGTTSYGPATAPDDVNFATITIDRTATRGQTQGLNGQPATTTMQIEVWQSNDSGATWFFRAGAGLIGGIYSSNLAGDPYLASNVTVELEPGVGRRIRGDVTVAGARVAIAGSLTVTAPPVVEVA